MKALVCTEPLRLEFEQRPDPSAEPGQAILRIRRIGVCGTDLHAYDGTQPYFSYPRILGHELSADIVDIEPGRGFEPGETVTFLPYLNCGQCVACRRGKSNCCVQMQVIGVHVDGGMAEYIRVPVDKLVKSRGLGHDALAMVEPLAIGAHAARIAAIVPGERVLVVGAGPIGMAIMEAAQLQDGEVIALDTQASRLEICRRDGRASYVVNSSNGNVMEHLQEITSGEMPTAVFDATGNLRAIEAGLQYVAHGGRYVLVGLQKAPFAFSHPEFHKRETCLMSSRNATREDFDNVIDAIASGKTEPLTMITHRTEFRDAAAKFPFWLDPVSGVLKAMIHND
ncbi:zinc-binding alcohol dehydrogenase family protein [Flavihumibacter petaseus]|uniref:Putative L-galactonate oxidoreductase n=1 Tax=Flavihumibacter petaseus NBRC 106054 TaxID=1220578 RepID=A0A0E9MWE2_9BACT|nr:zinc-binding alcohol dehydrogenase family protein [Flavihumibacter petaseus]GAO41889.1 putative L-galactonate oxidoreductase [Flavihumibacter petaseus NBRC 106054]